MRLGRSILACAAVGIVAALACADLRGAAAQDGEALAQSMASALVKSRTQLRILRRDDRADAACARRIFVAARVVRAPVRTLVDAAVHETKWEEVWTLDRCGREVGYRVFFTEVGTGGTYFSILDSY